RLSQDAGPRLEPELLRLLLAHEQDRGGSVADLAGVAGGDRMLRVESGLQGGGRFISGATPDPFVLVEDLVVAVALDGDLDRHDLRLQVPLVCGLRGEQMA